MLQRKIKNLTLILSLLPKKLLGVTKMIDIFTGLGAGIAVNRHCVREAIIQILQIHTNVIRIAENGNFEITKQSPKLSKTVDLRKLKGYNLSELVMQISIPAFTFQLYINPCLRWVIQHGFMILAAKLLLGLNNNHEFDECKCDGALE